MGVARDGIGLHGSFRRVVGKTWNKNTGGGKRGNINVGTANDGCERG